ncbi:hypothetical protein [Nocardioides sp. 616]|uniref:hypothetical protein n=1 Tax=Nocardioides sp. 616 TaxID=2268090 RepID=UPI0013B42A56|nr:hypothetical protein [Nocardioides sp. 616]
MSEAATPVDETAEEFIQRWAELNRDMQNIGASPEYERITRGCEPCQGAIERIAEIHAAGGFVEWDGMEITRIKKMYTRSYDVWATSAPTRYKNSESSPVERFKGGPHKFMLTLRRTADGFVVDDLARRPL